MSYDLVQLVLISLYSVGHLVMVRITHMELGTELEVCLFVFLI